MNGAFIRELLPIERVGLLIEIFKRINFYLANFEKNWWQRGPLAHCLNEKATTKWHRSWWLAHHNLPYPCKQSRPTESWSDKTFIYLGWNICQTPFQVRLLKNIIMGIFQKKNHRTNSSKATKCVSNAFYQKSFQKFVIPKVRWHLIKGANERIVQLIVH